MAELEDDCKYNYLILSSPASVVLVGASSSPISPSLRGLIYVLEACTKYLDLPKETKF